LGEIETVLGQHDAVRQCVVTVCEDVPIEKHLVAYIIVNQKFDFSISELRSFLKKKLPDYMLPSTFVLLDTLPLTCNGKIDRKALPKPHDALQPDMGVDCLEPTNNLELIVVRVWKEVLGLEQVGVVNNFFDLGGTSLLIGVLQRSLEQRLNRNISMIELFEYPTIRDFVQYLVNNEKEFDVSFLEKKIQRRIRWLKGRQEEQFQEFGGK
jgi:acyl carrier protein